MALIDLVILLPVIPLLPVLVTWWLPWEKWIPWAKLPLRFAGPYLLYCSFAAWHFKLEFWAVAVLAVAGIIGCLVVAGALVLAKRYGHEREF